MACTEWNHDWIGHLYDELAPDEERRLAAHLAVCAACRAQLEALQETRRALRTATPEVPASPRVVVLRPRRQTRPAWAFAAGLAAAAIVFAVGLTVGLGWSDPASPVGSAAARLPVDAAAATEPREELLDARVGAIEQRLADLGRTRRDASPDATLVTGDQLAEHLARLERRHELERARDIEFLLGEIAATEWRAGNWVDETRQALFRYAAQRDPRVSER